MELVEIGPPAQDVELALAYATPREYHRHADLSPGALLSAPRGGGSARRAPSRWPRPLGLRLQDLRRLPAERGAVDAVERSSRSRVPRRPAPRLAAFARRRRRSDAGRRRRRELEMGTGFDDFTPVAHHASLDVSPAAQRNRALLLGLMTAAGWDFYRNEWWHYQLFNARRFPLYSDSALTSRADVARSRCRRLVTGSGRPRRTPAAALRGMQLLPVAIAEIAEEVRLPAPVGKELGIHLGIVEARHRPAIEPERPRRDDQIGALQRAVAERRSRISSSLPTNQLRASAGGAVAAADS